MPRRLHLAKETLRRLGTSNLQGIVGGTGPDSVDVTCSAIQGCDASILDCPVNPPGPVGGPDDNFTITVRPMTRNATDANCY